MVASDDSPCTDEQISITYADLSEQATAGNHILVADGTIDLEKVAVEGRLTWVHGPFGRPTEKPQKRKHPGDQEPPAGHHAITGNDRGNVDFHQPAKASN